MVLLFRTIQIGRHEGTEMNDVYVVVLTVHDIKSIDLQRTATALWRHE